MHPYMLKPAEGRIYRYGVDFTVEAGELQLAWPRLGSGAEEASHYGC